MTNFEKITKSPEILAGVISNRSCELCAYGEDIVGCRATSDCEVGIQKWIEQEAKEEAE